MYYIMVLRAGLVYDRQTVAAAGFSITTYIREMLAHGYGLDITFTPLDKSTGSV